MENATRYTYTSRRVSPLSREREWVNVTLLISKQSHRKTDCAFKYARLYAVCFDKLFRQIPPESKHKPNVYTGQPPLKHEQSR